MTYLLGLIIGSVLGLTGAGGSVFAVPLLIYLLQQSPQQAIGISLGAVSLCALYGVIIRIKSGYIQWLPAIVFAAIGSLFSPLGNWLNQFIPAPILLICFGVLVLLIALRMWQQAVKVPEHSRVVRANKQLSADTPQALCKMNQNQPFAIGPKCVAGISFAAVMTGLLSGMFGVGGGFLIIPSLLFLTAINMVQAVATSLVIIALVSGSGFVSYLLNTPSLDFPLLAKIALGGIIGMTLGIIASNKIAGPNLQKGFAVLMILMAAFIIFQSLPTETIS
jgi:uncharacterized membrane protein YfcA